MGPKKDGSASDSKRNVVTMEDKLNMIKMYDKGEKVSGIARALGIPRSTVSTIVHDRERILAYVAGRAPSLKTAVINLKRGRIFDEMERLLSSWIERQTRERMPTSQLLIQDKAKSLFQDLLKKYPEETDTTFIASSGWFARFKRRFSSRGGNIWGEYAAAVALAGVECPDAPQKTVKAEGISAEQILNVDDLSKNSVSLSDDLEPESEDFDGLIEADERPLSNEDLTASEEHRREEEDLTELEPRQFTVAEMQTGFHYLSKCLAVFGAQDPNAERFAKIMNGTNDLFLPYRTILNERKKRAFQGTSDKFPVKDEKRKVFESSTEQPTPSTSGVLTKKPSVSSPAASPPPPTTNEFLSHQPSPLRGASKRKRRQV